MKTNLEPVKKILRKFLLEIESAKHMFFSMSAPCMASACSLKDREPLFGTLDPDPPSQAQWEKEEAYVFFKIYEDCKFHILLIGGLASLAVTIIFWCLEYRNKQLVEIGRKGCELMEHELAQRLPPPLGRKKMCFHAIEEYYKDLKIVTQAEKNRRGASYRAGLLGLFILALLLHSLAIGTAFYYLCISKEEKCKTRIDEPIEIKIIQ